MPCVSVFIFPWWVDRVAFQRHPMVTFWRKIQGSWLWLNTPRKLQVYRFSITWGSGDPWRLIRFCFFKMIFLCFSIFSEMPSTSVLFSLLFLSSPLGITKRILWDGSKSQKICHVCTMLICWIFRWDILLHRNQDVEGFPADLPCFCCDAKSKH